MPKIDYAAMPNIQGFILMGFLILWPLLAHLHERRNKK